jgi:hypothetical protein
MFVSRDKAHQLFTSSSRQFIDKFLCTRPDAQKIRSREPAAAWNASGAVNYVSLSPWQPYHVQPDKVRGPAPLLISVQVNWRPPPGLFYILRSRAFQAKLSIRPEAPISEAPKLELIVDPEELLPFAMWLAEWDEKQAQQAALAPKSPISLFTAEANYDFSGDDGRWLYYEDLWTQSAYQQFDQWFTESKG